MEHKDIIKYNILNKKVKFQCLQRKILKKYLKYLQHVHNIKINISEKEYICIQKTGFEVKEIV